MTLVFLKRNNNFLMLFSYSVNLTESCNTLYKNVFYVVFCWDILTILNEIEIRKLLVSK